MAPWDKEVLEKTNQHKINTMKLSKSTLAIILAVSALSLPILQAATWVETSKGPRMSADGKHEGKVLNTADDFMNLKKGDKVEAYCPMMKKTYTTTITDVDSKGRQKVTRTTAGWDADGCDVKIIKNKDSKETHTMMVCPDGTLTPVECRKMS
jgi:hypothetical protein